MAIDLRSLAPSVTDLIFIIYAFLFVPRALLSIALNWLSWDGVGVGRSSKRIDEVACTTTVQFYSDFARFLLFTQLFSLYPPVVVPKAWHHESRPWTRQRMFVTRQEDGRRAGAYTSSQLWRGSCGSNCARTWTIWTFNQDMDIQRQRQKGEDISSFRFDRLSCSRLLHSEERPLRHLIAKPESNPFGSWNYQSNCANVLGQVR